MIRELLADRLAHALEAAVAAGDLPPTEAGAIHVERARHEAHGDFASNVAMVLAKSARRRPLDIAQALSARLETRDDVAEITVAAPGFLNIRVSDVFLRRSLQAILKEGPGHGRSQVGAGETVLIEYVSANPTGPLHVGHGRWAVLGSALAATMTWAGYAVSQEFYINDAGNQLQNLGRSLMYRMEGRALPEDASEFYGGDYVEQAAAAAREQLGDLSALDEDARIRRLADFGRDWFLAAQDATLGRLGTRFDRWVSERTLHEAGAVERMLGEMETSGAVVRRDGALWLTSSAHGDTEDRVVVRADGRPTYLAADMAYHADKFARGHERLLNIWGADHHGYVARMRAAVACMGRNPDQLEVVLGQLVKLFREGQEVRMSKRTGDMVTLDEVLDEVGRDATRWFLVARSADSTIDFDLDLARQESSDNPVYYVQYAHARICSIMRAAAEAGHLPESWDAVDLQSFDAPEERALALWLAGFTDEVAGAALAREPHRLTRYATDLAQRYHAFYTQCRVIDAAHPERTVTRLALCAATRQVLAILLESLLGIAAPEAM
ncbi:MAG: arginine--tRNA ligase [Candidatus Sericytochromatia bacterium]|nr:arginine--tRNA ligase [Candidatus Sericytochromatia bacterium]